MPGKAESATARGLRRLQLRVYAAQLFSGVHLKAYVINAHRLVPGRDREIHARFLFG
jgi:hypothetical protein